MPTPSVVTVSHSELNVTWTQPDIKDSRGIIRHYNLYVYQKMDLKVNPNAPPYKWQVITPVLANMSISFVLILFIIIMILFQCLSFFSIFFIFI